MDALAAVVESSAKHAAPTTSDARGKHQANLIKLARSWRGGSNPEALRRMVREVDREYAAYAEQVRDHFNAQEERLRQAMASLALLAELLAPGEKLLEVRFHGLADRLRKLASRASFATLAQKLEQELLTLGHYAESRHLTKAPRLARFEPIGFETIDPVTGLPDDFEARAGFDRRAARDEPFCAVHLRIDRLASLAERIGEEALSQVTGQMARRLKEQLDASTPAYRWQRGEFAVLAPGGIAGQEERWSQVQQSLSGVYHLRSGAGHVQVSVRCVMNMAEYKQGMSLASAIANCESNQLQHSWYARS
jgi:GGDEF domain-containing protein